MELRCVHCGESAEYIFQGCSFCERHFVESAKRAGEEASKPEVERIREAQEWARKMVEGVKGAEKIEREVSDIIQKAKGKKE